MGQICHQNTTKMVMLLVTTTTEPWTLPQQDGNHLSHALITVKSPQTTFSQLSTATGAHKETTTSRSSLLKDLPPVPSHSTLESTLPTLLLMVLRDLPPLPETLLPLISELRTSETHRLSTLLSPRESQMLSDAHSADKS